MRPGRTRREPRPTRRGSANWTWRERPAWRRVSPPCSESRPGRRARRASCSEAEAAHPALSPAQVVGQLVAHGALDLRPQQLGIVAEIALQRVLVDDDAVWVNVAGDGAADVVAVGMVLVTAAGDDHGRALEQLAKLLREV